MYVAYALCALPFSKCLSAEGIWLSKDTAAASDGWTSIHSPWQAFADVSPISTVNAGASAVPGDIVVPDGQTQTITTLVDIQGSASGDHKVTYGGITTSDYKNPFIVQGAQGSLRAQGGILLGPNTQIQVIDSPVYSGVAGGRIGDNTPVQLTSAVFSYTNNFSPARNLSETIGPLRIAGYSTLTFTPSSSAGNGTTTVTANTLERMGRGTLEILTVGGLGTSGNGTGYLQLNTPPELADGSVVPYVTARTNSSTYGIVVYDSSTGLRLLTPSEYTTTISGVTSFSHLQIPSNISLTNNDALTVRSLNLGVGGTLTGTGSLTISSGLVLAPGSGARVDNALDFGAHEALIAAESNGVMTEFLKPLTGTGGLTLYGIGTTAFTGGNQISGPLVLNGRASVAVTSQTDLGPDSSEIQINGRDYGAGLRLGRSSMELTRPVRVNSGYFAVAAENSGTTLTLNGGIAGAGGLFVLGLSGLPRGYTVLSGTNTYTGPTVVGGNLSFFSDSAFGNTSSIVMSGGTIKLLDNWTTARVWESSAQSTTVLNLDTNGYDVDFQGTLAGSATPYIAKKGNGHLYFSHPTDAVASAFRVSGGEVVLRADARLKTPAVELDSGGVFTIDNQTQNASRGVFNLNVVGGEFRILGNASQATTVACDVHVSDTSFSGPSSGVVTLAASGAAPVSLNVTNLSYDPDYALLVRGDNIGGSSASSYTRFRATNRPAMVGGIFPQIITDSSSAGFGTSFATYDTTSDAAGVIGLRPLRPGEMVSTAQLANPSNGGSTAVTANFLALGNVSTGGAANTVNSLTMDPGSRLTIAASPGLTITQNALLVRAGTMAELSGENIRAASSTLTLLGGGDLRLAAPVVRDSIFRQFGQGILLVTKAQPISTFKLSAGSLQVGAGDPLGNANIIADATAHFDLIGAATRIGTFNGSGEINLAGGSLTVASPVSGVTGASSIDGPITGPGTFVAESPVTLSGDSPFTGTLVVRGGVTVTGTLSSLAGIALRGGSLVLDRTVLHATTPRIPTSVPISSDGGSITLTTEADSTDVLGPLTGAGITRLLIGNSTSSPSVRAGTLAFADLQRSGRAGFIFTTDVLPGHTAQFDIKADISSQLVGDPSVVTARPILPYAILDNRPSTFERGVGLRPLRAGEQTATFVDGQNVAPVSGTTFNGEASVNSLENTSILQGTGLIHVTSGFVIASGAIAPALDFGATEGKIFTVNVASSPQVSGKISGSNGLTISGSYQLALLAQNTFTGSLTVNGSNVSFSSMGNLGLDVSPVSLSGGTLTATTSNFTFSRGLDLEGALSTFSGGTLSQPMTLAGIISGPGNLRVAGVIILGNGGNTYSGATRVAGTLKIGSDAVLGSSPVLEAATNVTGVATIELIAPWTTNRRISVEETNLNINTAGFDAVISGSLNGARQFQKSGTGSLTLNDGGSFTGGMWVRAGTLRLNSKFDDSSVDILVDGRLEGQAKLVRPMTLNGTLAPGIGIGTLETGSVSLASGSKLELEVVSAAEFDQLRIDGTITFAGLTQLSILVASGVQLPASWPIVLNDGSDPIGTSTTSGFAIGSAVLTEGANFFIGSQLARITYKGGDGNDVYIVAVPEPESAGLAGFGMAILAGIRFHRRRF